MDQRIKIQGNIWGEMPDGERLTRQFEYFVKWPCPVVKESFLPTLEAYGRVIYGDKFKRIEIESQVLAADDEYVDCFEGFVVLE
jgi:hypothetical protein